MAYKANFRPLEGLIDGHWGLLDPTTMHSAGTPPMPGRMPADKSRR
jgi:arginine-tRNA-protein transferase